jgi:hypothetical protein
MARKHDWFALGGLVLPCVSALGIYLLRAGTIYIYDDDNLSQWVPYREFINQAIAQGILPAWCPDLNCGFPFIAWPHTSVWSLAGVFYYYFPFPTAAALTFFVSLLVYNLGLYYWLRGLKIRPFSSFAATVAAGFGFFS